MSWLFGVLMATEPDQGQYRGGDLMGEPLDSHEVAKARQLDIGDFKHMHDYQKVPTQMAREAGH